MSSPQSTPLTPNDFIVLATIVRPHGLKGEVKVSLSCSGVDRLAACKSLRLIRDGKELKKVSVMRTFMHPDGGAVVRLKEVLGVDEAETLRGAALAVAASDMEQLPEDTFYLHDLVGMKVETGAGTPLGIIEEVMEGLANGVLIVRDGAKETLIPALKSVIRKVDLRSRKMTVELPEEIDGDHAD